MVHELDISKDTIMCPDDICLFKEGHHHISANQHNFVLLPYIHVLSLSPRLPEKFIASSGTWSSHHHQENNATLFTPILVI